MADDIIIKFKPVGDRALVRAIQELQRATQKYGGSIPQVNEQAKKLTAQLKAQGKNWKALGVQVKTIKQAYRGNTTALEKMRVAMQKTNTGMFSLTNNGRLLSNAFATMRSKLLLVSFGFGLVTAAIGRNIEAFGKQEDSLARLILQFGKGGRQLAKYASSLQKVTRFGDESINAAMAQFGAYGATIEQTKLLTEATLNFAEGAMMDLNSASLLIAKSFNSSTNALTRYGMEIDTSASQSEKISQLISEIDKKYGGLAKTMGGLASSEAKQLSMAMGDMQERFGQALAEALNPLIRAFTALGESINVEIFRILIKAVMMASAAFVILKSGKVLLGVVTSFKAAITAVNTYTASTTIATTATGILSKAMIAFFRTLTVKTGGLYLVVIGIGYLITWLAEAFGLFGDTTDEVKKLEKELEKLEKTTLEFDTDNGVSELDKFYQKLKEGNELFALSGRRLEEDFISSFDFSITSAGISEYISEISGEYENAVNEINEIINNPALRGTMGMGFVTHFAMGLAKINKLNEEFANKLDEASDSVGALEASFKVNFMSITGVTGEFFDKYIKNSEIKQAIDQGLIKNNKDLLVVLEASVKQGLSLNAATIEEVLLNEHNKTLLQGLTDAYNSTDEAKLAVLETTIAEAEALFFLNELNAEQIKGLDILIQKYNELIDKINGKTDATKEDKKWSELTFNEQLGHVADLAGALGSLVGSTGKNRLQAARLTQSAAIIDTYAGANKAFAQGGTLGFITGATIIAQGMANVARIEAQLSKMGSSGSAVGKFEHGGYVGGRPHSQGGTIIEAERGEFVMSRNAVESIGLETLNQMNEGGGGGINITVTGNVMTQDFVEGELAESIKEAVRRGSDFGIS